ncbi:hypothetical protein X275_07880 [Marinitoga sp. 1197]|uniref:hypothetical protein n=1 Tax=Marinitoga sp. 1197 TaxID=1428449 RepID=UPI0006413243|nr:hypothetical protein [Marinitoga sp. 1197]KLO21842.1 hypothetical protein X275_07880 [Marinitoga sp. 1197]
MKKDFVLFLILLLSGFIFSETYYVIGNMVYKGSSNSNQTGYELKYFSPEKEIQEISDKRIIIIKDGIKESINSMYQKEGNMNIKSSDEIIVDGNFIKTKTTLNLFEKSHLFEYFMPKDFKYWKIGGRQEDTNYMGLDTLNNTIWYKIHKTGYSENTLYKDFELPYGINSFVDFSAEIAGLVTKSKVLPEKTYSAAGIIFSFLNKDKKNIDKFSFVWSSSQHPFKEHIWINPMPLTNNSDFHISFNIKDITDNKDVKYIRIIFWTFGSDSYKTLTANLWIRNVKINLSKAK